MGGVRRAMRASFGGEGRGLYGSFDHEIGCLCFSQIVRELSF